MAPSVAEGAILSSLSWSEKRQAGHLRIAQGLWPKPVSLGARAVGWPAGEVSALNAARIASQSDEEIRALVARLEAERSTAYGNR
jgi:prophage regulatory protein